MVDFKKLLEKKQREKFEKIDPSFPKIISNSKPKPKPKSKRKQKDEKKSPVAVQFMPLEEDGMFYSWWRDGRITKHTERHKQEPSPLEVLATDRFDWCMGLLVQFVQENEGTGFKGRTDLRNRHVKSPELKTIRKRRSKADEWQE